MVERRWSDTDRELVAEVLYRQKFPDETEPWDNIVAAYPIVDLRFRPDAAAILDALADAGRLVLEDVAGGEPTRRPADFYVVIEVERPGAEPGDDQHLCLLPTESCAREIGDDLYEHYRVYALREVVGGEPAPGEAFDLDAIDARANAATPPPWHGEHEVYEGRELPCVSIGNYGWVCSGERSPEYDVDSEQGKADAEFIAHARADVPALVAEVRRLRAEAGQ